MPIVAAALCGCGEAREQPATGPARSEDGAARRQAVRSEDGAARRQAVRSEEHRFTAALPGGWTLASESLTPSLANPVEILAAGTVPDLQPGGGSCGHLPGGALERLGPRDAFVTVQERYGEPRFPDRPERFALIGRVEHGDAASCARREGRLEEYWFGFRDAGRGFHVLVAFGPEAPAERRREALALLDSLRFEPGPPGVRLDPDLTVPFEDRAAGLSWQMPVPPWRRYDWPLTSTQPERLALGTFDLARGRRDSNCTPRAALDAMPSDGAFVYVFEYVDLEERWRARIPERTGELRLRPQVAYECMARAAWRRGRSAAGRSRRTCTSARARTRDSSATRCRS